MNIVNRRFVEISCILLVFMTTPFAPRNIVAAEFAVRSPRLLLEGSPDTYDIDSIIASIIKPAMTSEAKALAVYDFMRAYVYHWGTAREYPDRSNYDYGVVYDPVKLINVYGYGYCFQNRAAVEALWQAAGLEARSAGIGGHSVAEVYYDGQYHYLDADQHGYCFLPDGKTIASIEQLGYDPIGLILKQPHKTNPYFPYSNDPKVPYESKIIFAAYMATTKDNFYQHDKIVTGHRMDITLLPGMRLERRFNSDGRWNIHNSSSEFEYQAGYHDPVAGPKDAFSGTGYANGELLYQPDLTTRSGEYVAGVWHDSNMNVTTDGLAATTAGRPAWSIFRIRLPYVIVGWPTSFTGASDMRGAAVVAADFSGGGRGQGLDVSVDNGLTWIPVWTNDSGNAEQALVDLSEHVSFRYEYLVRVRLSNAATQNEKLKALSIRTAFQLAPRALPALKVGNNNFKLTLGDQSEVAETAIIMKDYDELMRHIYSLRNVRLQNGRLMSKGGETGDLILALEPPKSGNVSAFSIEAGCRREPVNYHPDDDIRIYYALNKPESWVLAYDDEVPPYAQHWCYHANASANCPEGTKAIYVKIELRTASSASIQFLRWRNYWRPDGEHGMPERGLKVVHGWVEKGVAKEHTEIVKDVSYNYTVKADEEPINKYFVMEPVRAAGLTWRDSYPPVIIPELPQNTVLEPGLRDELRSLLREIDADPTVGLPKAVASKIGWLSGAAKQGQFMMSNKYPLPPKKPNATLNQFADEAKRAQAVKILLGKNGYAKIKVLEQFAASGAKELPDDIIGALSDSWKYVRLAAVEAIRSSGDKKAVNALQKMAKDDPEPWLRAEALYTLQSLQQ